MNYICSGMCVRVWERQSSAESAEFDLIGMEEKGFL